MDDKPAARATSSSVGARGGTERDVFDMFTHRAFSVFMILALYYTHFSLHCRRASEISALAGVFSFLC
jgi:hypothetical protein